MSKVVPTRVIQELQHNTSNIRNICILAHVDHGKTSLTDSLISSNGIISAKMAGKLRYMDSRPDEQERCITMKSSSISLLYNHLNNQDYLINLIDSPGHVDFSSEVSTAVRLCDGALVLVDVLEGVCTQTRTVLRQAWEEGVKPCLFLNKIDRLILELQLTPHEAYLHMSQIIEQVNAIQSSFLTADLMKGDSDNTTVAHIPAAASASVDSESGEINFENWSFEYSESLEQEHIFHPARGNVVFGCAVDCWAFTLPTFADIYAKKLGINKQALQQCLWGEFYYNPKTKKVYEKPQGKSKAMFVSFVLENIWQVYSAVVQDPNHDKVQKIVSVLNLDIPTRELNSNGRDPKQLLQALMSRWLPVSSAVLGMVVDLLPNPITAQANRMTKLWPTQQLAMDNEEMERVRQAVMQCDKSETAPTVIFVSKMLNVDAMGSDLAGRNARTASQESAFVGFARIFAGVLRKGASIYVLTPRYNPSNPGRHNVLVHGLTPYLMMGRSLEPLEEVPAGNMLGIGGLEEHVLKTATLCSTLSCPSFTLMNFQAAAIVRVAIEPERANEMSVLVHGLKLLSQADPAVEVYLDSSGEHVLATCGEVHLERCLKDLNELYAKIQIRVSPPLVNFRETIVSTSLPKPTAASYVSFAEGGVLNPDGSVSCDTPNRKCTITVRAVPLPQPFVRWLDVQTPLIRALFIDPSLKASVKTRAGSLDEKDKMLATDTSVESFRQSLTLQLVQALAEETDDKIKSLLPVEQTVDRIWSFGPRRVGPNLLVNLVPGFTHTGVWQRSATEADAEVAQISDYSQPFDAAVTNQITENQSVVALEADLAVQDRDMDLSERLSAVEHSLVAGFDLACASGPLCEESLMGVAIRVEHIRFNESTSDAEATDPYGPFSGQVMSAMKEACRHAFLCCSTRLVEAVYSLHLQTTQEVLGKVYGVLSKRRGEVLKEDMREGTNVFTIEALLPVVESFGFAEELRKKSSGAASPQLVFSHWQIVPIDPFYQPTTEEEIEEFGDQTFAPNLARKYMDVTRKRKGLPVDEKVVQHAEKQRTLGRNK
eukprot:GILK01009370.1.p1 GENE.GILK01009370.1~~GILK01009370.1.p1  ORF type:complete len:1052 (-),score=185.23 GILK01009370.1:177-3332(-)